MYNKKLYSFKFIDVQLYVTIHVHMQAPYKLGLAQDYVCT